MKLVITGPRSIGKTTTTQLLSKELNILLIESDAVMNEKLKQLGGLDKAIKSKNNKEIMNLGLEFVKETLEKNEFILDIAGGAVSKKQNEFSHINTQIREILNKNNQTICLLPFKEDNKSTELLFSREQKREHFKGRDKEDLLKKIKRNYDEFKAGIGELNKIIIFTENKSPEEIVKEIKEKIN